MGSVDRARNGFEDTFSRSLDYYNRQTNDDAHLEQIINTVSIGSGNRALDLGTGSGYLAFSLAKKYPSAFITGLDIVENTLKVNQQKAQERGIENINFSSYDGVFLPMANDFFEWVVTRYALHHFPDVQTTFNEIARVLKPGGKLFIADPVPNILDADRFVDRYMQLKNDGHNKFYTRQEFENFAQNSGLSLTSCFQTVIVFPRIIDDRYHELLDSTPNSIRQLYNIQIQENECYITEDVQNMVFSL